MSFDQYCKAIVGYLVIWECNTQWAINRIDSEFVKIVEDFTNEVAPRDCAYQLAGY